MIKIYDYAKSVVDYYFQLQYKKGIEKYGKPLTTFNSRDAFSDAMQETVDLLMYLNQLRMERNRLCEIIYNNLTPNSIEISYIEKHGSNGGNN
jgi:hypothetical protein